MAAVPVCCLTLTQTPRSVRYGNWLRRYLHGNLLRMKLLISARNVKKCCFLEVNQWNVHLLRVVWCHIEPVYCFSVPGRW